MKEQFDETVELETKLKELEVEEVKGCVRSFERTVWYKKIANLSLFVAIMAAGTASFWGGHQPKEPKM